MDLDLRTRVGKVTVEGVIGNSPGPRKSIEECHRVGKSPAAMIMLGSLTAEERKGNEGDVYYAEKVPKIALNSLGLPTRRFLDYVHRIEELKSYDKPIAVSIAGFTAAEFGALAQILSGLELTIELNMTCPNVEKKGIFAYDLTEVDRALRLVRLAAPSDNLVVKLNYHPDSAYIESMCYTLINHSVDAVALCNTLPNALVLNPETLEPVITPNNGLAGQSGSSIRPVVMGQVYQYRRLLPPDIDIICEGGIWTGFDILAYLVVGGSFCRIATMYAERGIKAFGELTFQFIEEMEKRGYQSLSEIPRLEDLSALKPV